MVVKKLSLESGTHQKRQEAMVRFMNEVNIMGKLKCVPVSMLMSVSLNYVTLMLFSAPRLW